MLLSTRPGQRPAIPSFQGQGPVTRLCRRLHNLRMKKRWSWLLSICVLCVGCRLWLDAGPSTAFFYGRPVPSELFLRYERVVVEADNMELDELSSESKAQLFAYLSVGEAERWRAGYESLQKHWFIGLNTNWNSDIADLTADGWRGYLLDQRMATLWEQGYRGFFLDTLDSYRAVLSDNAAQAAQQEALLSLIREMTRRFPGIQLIFNRGFDLLPEVGYLAVGLVAESLYYTWDPASQRYKKVDATDRSWLLEQLQTASRRYRLPVTVIDYLPPDQRELAHEDAKQIAALGFTPWVANPSLDIVGVGKADLAEE